MRALTHALRLTVVTMVVGAAAEGQAATVVGMIHATAPDGQLFAMPGVRLTLTCGTDAASTVVSDEQGQFQFANVPVGPCTVVTDVQGFKAVTAAFVHAAAERIDLPIVLEQEALYTGLVVTGGPLDVAVARRRRRGPNDAGHAPAPEPHRDPD